MNKAAQIIVSTASGERSPYCLREDYLWLLAASEDDEGEAKPEFEEKVSERRQKIADGGAVVGLDALRKKGR